MMEDEGLLVSLWLVELFGIYFVPLPLQLFVWAGCKFPCRNGVYRMITFFWKLSHVS
jgi:hypothetical protein